MKRFSLLLLVAAGFAQAIVANSAAAQDASQISFLGPPLPMEAELMAREVVAYPTRPTENFQLYVYRPINQTAGNMEKSVVWINYHVHSDSSETMRKGMEAIMAMMKKIGVIKWRSGLFHFEKVVLDGFAVDMMLRSGMTERQASELLRKTDGGHDVWYANAAFAYWAEVRDFIRTSAGLRAGYEQSTRLFADAVEISEQ